MSAKAATARIKRKKLLEAAGRRFFEDEKGPANSRLEPTAALPASELDALGENGEKSARGFVDFLLLDACGFPLIVLEAKAGDIALLTATDGGRESAHCAAAPVAV